MADPRKPNIVFVFADEWRAQAAGYAGDVNCQTPAIDAFAQQSINVTHAVAGCPVCCPYRASLMTGQYPLTNGVFINDVELSPDCTSIADAFNAAGYQTAYMGKWHLYGSPDGHYQRRKSRVPRSHQLRFDDWRAFECNHNYNQSFYYHNDDPALHRWEGYDAFAQAQAAGEYVRKHADDDQPFMLMLSWGPPHFPLDSAPDGYRAMYADRAIELRPNVPHDLRDQAADYLRGYYAHIAALDDALASLLDAIEQAGAADDTIVILTADHGEMALSQGLHTKLFPFDESIRVPFLLRDPRRRHDAGRCIPLPIDAPDIMPTLLGLVDADKPTTIEGVDWSPVIRGEQPVTGDEAALLVLAAEFTEIRDNDMRAYRGLRTSRYTYVRDTTGPWLLFDNEADPYQKRNLIGRPEADELQRRMDANLRERLSLLGDPFEPGAVCLERHGLTHYREVNSPAKRTWRYPWDDMFGPDGRPHSTPLPVWRDPQA